MGEVGSKTTWHRLVIFKEAAEECRRDTDTETSNKKRELLAPFFVELFKFRGLF
jgi:hypothetical protein